MTGTYKIKTWEKMKKDFGISSTKDINTRPVFMNDMEKTLPEDRIIKINNNQWLGYIISTDMIETEVFDVRKMSVEDFLKIDLGKGRLEFFDIDTNFWYKSPLVSFDGIINQFLNYENPYRYIPPTKPDPPPVPDHMTIMTSIWKAEDALEYKVFSYDPSEEHYCMIHPRTGGIILTKPSWFADKKIVE